MRAIKSDSVKLVSQQPLPTDNLKGKERKIIRTSTSTKLLLRIFASNSKGAFQQKLNIKDSLKKLGATFLSASEFSVQECVYRCMPELWLEKCFQTIFVNTNLPESRLKMIKKKQELEQIDEQITDIFQRNLMDRYTDHRYVDYVNNLVSQSLLHTTTKYQNMIQNMKILQMLTSPRFLQMMLQRVYMKRTLHFLRKLTLLVSKKS